MIRQIVHSKACRRMLDNNAVIWQSIMIDLLNVLAKLKNVHFWWETIQRINPSESKWSITRWWDEPIVPTAVERLSTAERLRVCLSTNPSPDKVDKCLLILSPHVRKAAFNHTLTCRSLNLENYGKQATASGSSQPVFNAAHTFRITLDDALIFNSFNEQLKTHVRTLTSAVIPSYLLFLPSKVSKFQST